MQTLQGESSFHLEGMLAGAYIQIAKAVAFVRRSQKPTMFADDQSR
jgi:hypothetical protein